MTETTTGKQLIRVGHSPDPDDAFMFYALAYEKIPMKGFEIKHVVEDIESLNQRALKNAELEVTAVSCHAYSYLADKYIIKRCGSSVGDNYGPILVTKQGNSHNFKGKKIGIPGKLTTAYLVMQIFEKDFEPVFIDFDKIFDAVEKGEVDYGLIIHEGQITFNQKGFELVLDLGKWWHEQFNLPLPLGIDVIRRDLGEETIKSFTQLFKDSIEYALAHRKEALEYAQTFGRGIQADLNDQFVGMYVNDLTVDIGERGQKGLEKLYDLAYEKKILPHRIQPEFVEL